MKLKGGWVGLHIATCERVRVWSPSQVNAVREKQPKMGNFRDMGCSCFRSLENIFETGKHPIHAQLPPTLPTPISTKDVKLFLKKKNDYLNFTNAVLWLYVGAIVLIYKNDGLDYPKNVGATVFKYMYNKEMLGHTKICNIKYKL